MSQLLKDLRQAIDASPKSRYRIAMDTGISEPQLSKLMSRQCGLSIESAELLAEYLDLEIVLKPRRRVRKGRKSW